ncbi:hypothetical protein [Nocardiopsis gilva]|uniref:hypothetical protein n=1 Tax=Nocardiopsis gilva TaxID=280236 RepID=UPI00034C7003|nr:hypothetical protein [Nocardiopsis gilva]
MHAPGAGTTRRPALRAEPHQGVSWTGWSWGLLVDLLEEVGLSALPQVDRGWREHTS